MGFVIEIERKFDFELEFRINTAKIKAATKLNNETVCNQMIYKIADKFTDKFLNTDKRIRFTKYSDSLALYVKVSVEDCTPVYNMTRDIIMELGYDYRGSEHQE